MTGSRASARQASFERLFERNYRAVSAYARRRAGAGEADDAVAETFLVAWRRLDDMPEEERPWLFGVARRVLANQRRAAARRNALAGRLSGAPIEREPADEAPVLRALASLAERDREVLMLTAWEGLTSEEAARVLGCSRTAAKVRLHRARGRLRARLAELGGEAAVSTNRRLEECHEE
jgi:RNA polymerase sigma-70 factor (ECF subfamily)